MTNRMERADAVLFGATALPLVNVTWNDGRIAVDVRSLAVLPTSQADQEAAKLHGRLRDHDALPELPLRPDDALYGAPCTCDLV